MTDEKTFIDGMKSPHFATEAQEPALEEYRIGGNNGDIIHSDDHDAVTGRVPWIYRCVRIGPYTLPFYASPVVQLLLVSIVCLLCPGMFNALSGLGGGGRVDTRLADDMNIALYSTFGVIGMLSGPLVNLMGVKAGLFVGGFGYWLYALILLLSKHNESPEIWGGAIFIGAFLGFCAALLWTAQGTVMVSYPHENQKGRYFAWFWAIFNLGAILGSLIPLVQNINIIKNLDVNDGTYIAFIILMVLGCGLSLTLINTPYVVRHDFSRVIIVKSPSAKAEFIGMWHTLRYEWTVILLFPMFWSSNWFYTYQQNGINSAHFSTRTKALNNLLYYVSQIFGAFFLGYALDSKVKSRSWRGRANLVFLLCITCLFWGLGYVWQRGYTRETVSASTFIPTDWKSKEYIGPLILYMAYGFYDSLWQCSVYWYMGALSNSSNRTANYVGFYKGLQSAGAAVSWSLDSRKTPFMEEYMSNFVLLAGSLLIAAPVIFLKIKDHVENEIDVKDSDEPMEDVAPPSDIKHASASEQDRYLIEIAAKVSAARKRRL